MRKPFWYLGASFQQAAAAFVPHQDIYSRGTGNCRIAGSTARVAGVSKEALLLVHDNCHGEDWDTRQGLAKGSGSVPE